MNPVLVETILENRQGETFDVLEALQEIQQCYQYLPEQTLHRVSEALGIPLIEVYRLANFYKAFTLKPRGRHLLTTCLGTACHVQGAPRILDEVITQLGIQPGETTEDEAFTLEAVNCVGACALAPVVIIDGQYYDHVTPGKLRDLLQMVRERDQQEVAVYA